MEDVGRPEGGGTGSVAEVDDSVLGSCTGDGDTGVLLEFPRPSVLKPVECCTGSHSVLLSCPSSSGVCSV